MRKFEVKNRSTRNAAHALPSTPVANCFTRSRSSSIRACALVILAGILNSLKLFRRATPAPSLMTMDGGRERD